MRFSYISTLMEPGSLDPDLTVRGLLIAWRDGDSSALDRLMPLMYDELHSLARRQLRGERPDHTLQTTALLHEAYLKLIGADVQWDGRVHFLAVAATLMRRILVDHARARSRQKRGSGINEVPLDQADVAAPESSVDLIVLDEALTRLAAFDARKARAAELHYFGGLSYEETARALDISEATAHRDLRVAKAWLQRELGQDGGLASAT
jgi:RNA polymerase sigma factor (TIGR02999 family)